MLAPLEGDRGWYAPDRLCVRDRSGYMNVLEASADLEDTDTMGATEDLQSIVQRINHDNARAATRIAAAQRRAYRDACALANRMGTEDPTVRRVILFGSTVPGRRYRVGSDIDLAVEGGDRAFLERLSRELSQPVDIIGIDELRPGVRDQVLSEGVVLYEAEQK